MNVLVIGGYNSFATRLISNFSKEGHRVSVLTGSYHTGKKYERTFEQYNFAYNCSTMTEIFESVSPDVTVFMGAYDANFTWHDRQRDSVAFISAVMNILNAYSTLKKGRFVFLSSDAVFGYTHAAHISEETEPNAMDVLGMTMIESENLCEHFRRGYESDIIVLRVSGYYRQPATPKEADDPVSRACLKALKQGGAHSETNRDLMLLHETDACFFISQVALASEHRHDVYHISSGVTISERQLEGMIQSAIEKTGRARKETEPAPAPARVPAPADGQEDFAIGDPWEFHSILNVDRFKEEFGINRLADLQSAVTHIVDNMVRHEDIFLAVADEKKLRWKRVREKALLVFKAAVPFAENAVCFVLLYLAYPYLADSVFLSRVDLYLLYVLLFAVVHGQVQASLSAFLSILGMLLPKFLGDESARILLDYGTYVWMAQLFIVGMSAGYLKDRLISKREEAMEDHEYMASQIEDIREINGTNSRVKETLQLQLINHEESIGKIYSITSSIDSFHSVDVLFKATEALRAIIGSKDIAIYTITGTSDHARLFTATSEQARQFGHSFLYANSGEMFECFKERKVYLNKKLDKDYPVLANAVYEEDSIRFIVMVWTLPLEKLNRGTANLLNIVCRLIQDSAMRAAHYAQTIRHTQVFADTTVLLREPFRHLVDMCDAAAEKKLTEFFALRIDGVPEEKKVEAARKLSKTLRQNDYLGLGKNGHIYVLLSNTPMAGADTAIQRLKRAGFTAVIADHELI